MRVRAIEVGSGILAVVIAGSVGCAAPEGPVASRESIVYGSDDRLDYYAAGADLQQLTRESIVALIRPGNLDASDPSNVQVGGGTLGESYNLCTTERFVSQPAGAHCSGTLIAPDLVMTAGHCFRDGEVEASCADTRLVFDYFFESDGVLHTIDAAEDVYACRRVLVRRLEETADRTNHDYAIIQLDRPVAASHVPAPITSNRGPVARGSSVTIIGFGSGIPAKIDTGGMVVNERAGLLDYFRATTDSFGGNSGSGVFDTSGSTIGILVRGERDYVESGSCSVVNVVGADPGESGGEQISYVYDAVDALCATGWPSETLCARAASCGDGTCSGTETPADCASDCTAGTCGDGVCDVGEDETSCASDCTATPPTVPAEWACAPGSYDGLDGCDCECGASDPDCSVEGQTTYGCEPGQTCDAAGACAGTPVTVPATWACDASYYDAGDGCDCECGAADPDCDAAGAEVFGCGPDLACVDGACELAPETDAGVPETSDAMIPSTSDAGTTTPPPSGGCACSVAGASSNRAAMLALLAVGWLWARRRSSTRRSRASR